MKAPMDIKGGRYCGREFAPKTPLPSTRLRASDNYPDRSEMHLLPEQELTIEYRMLMRTLPKQTGRTSSKVGSLSGRSFG